MESLWTRTSDTAARPPLYGDTEAEVAVIGGGMAGILTALLLHERGLRTVVLEAERVGAELLDVPGLGRVEGRVAKAAGEEVLGGEPPDLVVVAADARQPEAGLRQRQVHDGNAAPTVVPNRVRQRRASVAERHEDAVAAPFARRVGAVLDRQVPAIPRGEAGNAALP